MHHAPSLELGDRQAQAKPIPPKVCSRGSQLRCCRMPPAIPLSPPSIALTTSRSAASFPSQGHQSLRQDGAAPRSSACSRIQANVRYSLPKTPPVYKRYSMCVAVTTLLAATDKFQAEKEAQKIVQKGECLSHQVCQLLTNDSPRM
jgi:hypothetical protein